MAKIGIFGGTFNPPHIGHIMAAKEAMSAMKLDRLIFVPSNIPPHKELPKKTATIEQRLEMTRIIAKEIGAEVSTIEAKRQGKSYTKDTVRDIKQLYPNDELYFIMGTDMLKSFLNWLEPQTILDNASLIALCRDERERKNMENYAQEIRTKLKGKVFVINNHIFTVSSTEIREKISQLIPPKVKKYIDENRLYI